MEAALKFNQQVEAVCRKVEHSEPSSDVKIGSAVTARWPQSACSNLDSAIPDFYKCYAYETAD